VSDYEDPGHGARGLAAALGLRGTMFDATYDQMHL
jgi:hypothetical protein